MRIYRILLLPLATLLALAAWADDEVPTINPTATYTDADGNEAESSSISGNAPLAVRFEANAEDVGSYVANYEWRFTLEGESEPYLIRYEEDTDYSFMAAGSHNVVLYATFVNGSDTIAYKEDYWADRGPITVVVSESKLEMPNAFSPNGDGVNDIYGAKQGWQSIVEFHAAIYNRWGQKLYEWDDPAGGWDGKFHGQDVKQGVYFVEVNAKGADGRKYHIRRDVNLLRGFSEVDGSTATE